MATSQMNEFIQYLRRTVLLTDGAGLTDGQLLSRFIELRDEDAFAALIKRHGPMVWGVCRRLLASHHDAEDAFQATFLVLVRKAVTVHPRERVANWLYGVAYMTAHRGKVAAAKAGRRERQVAKMPEPAAAEPSRWDDLRPVLDQELSRLPDAYREVVVLADLEGKTRKQVARLLDLPEGTVASRLARARTMLAKRLARHTSAWPLGTLAAVLAEGVASAGVPLSLVSRTIKAVTLVTAGQAAAAGAISLKVAALAEGVLRAMLFTKLKIIAAVVMICVAFTGGAVIYETQGAQELAIQRADEPVGAKRTPELERRVGELEKQVQALTNEVKGLQTKLTALSQGALAKTESKTFQLRHRSVEDVAQILWDMYRNKAGKEIRIGMDNATNTLMIVASPNDLGVLDALVTQLEKLPTKKQKEGEK
jgi:RNA polymerase sigma factor (sigma-70 family)